MLRIFRSAVRTDRRIRPQRSTAFAEHREKVSAAMSGSSRSYEVAQDRPLERSLQAEPTALFASACRDSSGSIVEYGLRRFLRLRPKTVMTHQGSRARIPT